MILCWYNSKNSHKNVKSRKGLTKYLYGLRLQFHTGFFLS